MPKLSIVVPAYNEEQTLVRCIERVLAIADEKLELEILVVDDASTDETLLRAQDVAAAHPQVRVIHHEINQGKGAALHTGFRHATGDFVAVQDADLEYNPQDLRRLLGPLESGSADVVIGSRFLSIGEHRVLYFWHSVGNRFLTLLSNMFTDLNLSDMETCYKVFRRDVLQKLELHEKRFGFEPEVVAQIARLRLRIYEMGISYAGPPTRRKKIGVKDGVRVMPSFATTAPRAPSRGVRRLPDCRRPLRGRQPAVLYGADHARVGTDRRADRVRTCGHLELLSVRHLPVSAQRQVGDVGRSDRVPVGRGCGGRH